MPKRTKEYRPWLLERLRDLHTAASYVNAAIHDSPEMFLKALRNVAEAHRMARVAEEADVSREALYRTLSENGNPTLNTLVSVLGALGLELAIQSKGEIANQGDSGSQLCETGNIEQAANFQLIRELQKPRLYGVSNAILAYYDNCGLGHSQAPDVTLDHLVAEETKRSGALGK